jgi:predicted anti-sigma-YlaC factor YlaD
VDVTGSTVVYRSPPVRPPIISCTQLVGLVSDYVEDRLPVQERLRFEEHLAVCGPCRAYFDQMRETIRLTGELREEALDPALRDAAVEAFRGWKGT